MKEYKLSEFVENPDNPQTVTDEAFARLVEKIRKNPDGLRANRIAFVTDHPAGKRVVLSGNKRLRALKKIRGESAAAPAEWFQDITAMSEDERREFLVNSNICEGDWDVDKLLQQFDRDELVDLMGTEELGKLLENVTAADDGSADAVKTEADAVPEVREKPISVRGKIYALGNHLLMCGDCTSAADCAEVMRGSKADMIITDPPYGIKRDGGFGGFWGFGGFGKPIARRVYDDEWDKSRPDKKCFDLILSHGNQAIVFGGNFFSDILPVGNFWIVWDKNNTMPTFGDCELAWTNIKRNSVKKYEVEYNGLIGKEKSRFHPTQKPELLMELIVNDFTQEGDTVADFFGGSGTTLIACEKTGRVCRMMEMDEHYCDVIRKRWAEYVHGEGCDWQVLTPEVSP